MDNNLTKPENFVIFGAQKSRNSLEHFNYLKQNNIKIFFFEQFYMHEGDLFHAFTESLMIANTNTDASFVSFDMDAAIVPGVSASLSTGIEPNKMAKLAYYAGKNQKVKGIDIMEVSPKNDINNFTSKLAADMIYYFIKGVSER